MSSPFESPDTQYIVLLNDDEQYSLWPAFAEVPAGWQVVHDRDSREACQTFVTEQWTDMRPKSLRAAMGEHEGDAANL